MMKNFILVLLISLSIISCKQDKFSVFLKCDNAQGLDKESEVNINGLNVGQVTNIDFDSEYNVIVKAEFDKERSLPIDSKFILASLDFLGTKGIVVEIGSSSNLIQNGDTLLLSPEAPYDFEVLEKITDDLINNNPLTNYLDSLSTQLEEINEKLE